MKVVPDTSVIVDGRITRLVRDELECAEIVIAEAVLAELEAQANMGRETGVSGLKELAVLREMHEKNQIKLTFVGGRPSYDQIKLAEGGEIDSLIRDLAYQENAILLTSDTIQAQIAKAKGVDVKYLHPEPDTKVKWINEYFENDVMSVHLRAGAKPKMKRGTPGNISIEIIDEKKSQETELRKLGHEIIERARRSTDGFIELDRGGATVVQLQDTRIVIVRPPFSDGFEITATRPVARISLDEYHLSEQLEERITEKKRGVMLAGPPGAGKSTLAQSVAEYLLEKDFVVKTMEKPRDLQVPEEITQYTDLQGSFENTADVLLLVRPDYTVFDEVRKTPDFKVFADMRLAGVGMIGVTHANRGIDALQRLIDRVELGMVPQVVDTIVFVEAGEIVKIYDISFTVKVPAGMTEQDLARPVIEVKDFEKSTTEYEVYSYGEQVVVMPVEETLKKEQEPLWKLAARFIEEDIGRYVHGRVICEVDSSDSVTVYMPEHQIPTIIGSGGERVRSIEEDLGVHIDVRALDEQKHNPNLKEVNTTKEPDKVVLYIGHWRSKESVDIYVDKEYLTTATVGTDGTIKVRKNTQAGKSLIKAIKNNKDIQVD
ncbi:MAG: PINc/VapC family ATPase [Thermoplasmata archaeon]